MGTVRRLASENKVDRLGRIFWREVAVLAVGR